MKTENKLAQDLAEDKETLKHCLERNEPQNGLWWAFDEKVLRVAKILDRWRQFTNTSEVIDYFESPHKFEDKMKFIVENM
jgi:hypothetical protein